MNRTNNPLPTVPSLLFATRRVVHVSEMQTFSIMREKNTRINSPRSCGLCRGG